MKGFHNSHKICITLLLLFSIFTATYAGSIEKSNYNKIIYNAFIARDMNKWAELIHTIETTNDLKTVDNKLELINYYYGYIGYLMGKKQYELAGKLIDKGENLIEEVLHQSPNNATDYSFKGAFLGFRIGICHYKAIFYESDSKSNVNKALELDPNNVQALIDKGNMLFYAPRIFGGDKQKALGYFLNGVAVMEKKKETNENWVYLNLLTMLASAYEKNDNLPQARATYEKILHIEPNLIWVKNDLYPKLLVKMKAHGKG